MTSERKLLMEVLKFFDDNEGWLVDRSAWDDGVSQFLDEMNILQQKFRAHMAKAKARHTASLSMVAGRQTQ